MSKQIINKKWTSSINPVDLIETFGHVQNFHFVLSPNLAWFIELWMWSNEVSTCFSLRHKSRLSSANTNLGVVKESETYAIYIKKKDLWKVRYAKRCTHIVFYHFKLKQNLLFDSRFLFELKWKRKFVTHTHTLPLERCAHRKHFNAPTDF